MASVETTPAKKKVLAFKPIEVGGKVICKIHNKLYRKKEKLLSMTGEEEEDVYPWIICKIELASNVSFFFFVGERSSEKNS